MLKQTSNELNKRNDSTSADTRKRPNKFAVELLGALPVNNPDLLGSLFKVFRFTTPGRGFESVAARFRSG